MKKFNDYRITINQKVNLLIVNQELFDDQIKDQNDAIRELVETFCKFKRVKIVSWLEYGNDVGIVCDRNNNVQLTRLFVTNIHTDMYFRSSNLNVVKSFFIGFRRRLCKDGYSENEIGLFVKKKK